MRNPIAEGIVIPTGHGGPNPKDSMNTRGGPYHPSSRGRSKQEGLRREGSQARNDQKGRGVASSGRKMASCTDKDEHGGGEGENEALERHRQMTFRVYKAHSGLGSIENRAEYLFG